MYIHSVYLLAYLILCPLVIDEIITHLYASGKKSISVESKDRYTFPTNAFQSGGYVFTIFTVAPVLMFCSAFEWDNSNTLMISKLPIFIVISLLSGTILLFFEIISWMLCLVKKKKFSDNKEWKKKTVFRLLEIFLCYSMVVICFLQYVLHENLYIIILC